MLNTLLGSLRDATPSSTVFICLVGEESTFTNGFILIYQIDLIHLITSSPSQFRMVYAWKIHYNG